MGGSALLAVVLATAFLSISATQLGERNIYHSVPVSANKHPQRAIVNIAVALKYCVLSRSVCRFTRCGLS